ncbi:hypothetical protein QJ48_28695 [Paenibacillus sp. A3]|nr:hypothetical protein QJ48_28695 [Paenibacillus sp. A3]
MSEAELEKEIIDGIPQDFVDFLKEIGQGTLADDFFQFFGCLVQADEFYDELIREEDHEELKDVLLFGRICTGDAVGFLTTDDWSIVEIWHDDDLTLHPVEEATFEEYINHLFSPEGE